MKISRTPRDFSRTPGGTRTPGWEPLEQMIVQKLIIIFNQMFYKFV